MIHVFKLNNLNICLDVNSGTVHLLDDISSDILSHAKSKEELNKAILSISGKYEDKDIEQASSEINSLIENGTLYTDDFDKKMFKKEKEDKVVMKAMCLHMAHDCNLRCKYCFADKGAYGGEKSLMSYEVAKKSIDFLLKNSGSKKNVEVDFFGGEPMLNFEVVKKTVAYARSVEKDYDKTVHFTITTNGSILDEESEKFINENMDNIVLSLDGRKEVNDNLRVYSSGAGSYDKVVDNIKKIANNRNGKSYFVRGTFTRDNLDFHNDVLHIYNELGLKEISIEPVSGGDFNFTDDEIDEILKEYEKFAIEYADQDDYSFYHFNYNLYNSPCIFKRISACGAGVDYLAVSPEGKFYACHQFVNEEQFVLGDVNNGVINFDLVNKFSKCNVFTKEGCEDCFAKFFCSGGCHASAFFENGDINKPDTKTCTLQRKRIECALMIEVKRAIDRSNNEK